MIMDYFKTWVIYESANQEPLDDIGCVSSFRGPVAACFNFFGFFGQVLYQDTPFITTKMCCAHPGSIKCRSNVALEQNRLGAKAVAGQVLKQTLEPLEQMLYFFDIHT